MKTSCLIVQLAWTVFILLLSNTVSAEEWSVYRVTSTDNSEETAAGPASYGIDGAFNAGYISDSTDNALGVKEWRVAMVKSKKIVSFFFQYRPDNKNNLGQA